MVFFNGSIVKFYLYQFAEEVGLLGLIFLLVVVGVVDALHEEFAVSDLVC